MKKIILLMSIFLSVTCSAESLRIMVSYPAGGAGDLVARFVQQQLNSQGDTVMVLNMPSAGGQMAVKEFARSPADGTVLLLTGSGPMVFKPLENPELRTTVDSLTPMMYTAELVYAVVASKKSGITSWAQLEQQARSRPIAAGSSSATNTAIAKAILGRMDVTYVPYNGDTPVVQNLLSNTLDIALVTYASVYEQIVSNNVVPLALTEEYHNNNDAVKIPSLKKLGQDFDYTGFYAMYLPPGTASDIRDHWYKKMTKIFDSAEAREFYQMHQMLLPRATDYRALDSKVRADTARWHDLYQH